MTPRAAGSGLHNDAALAVEELWAAHLEGSSRSQALSALRRARSRGYCGVAPARIDGWLASLAGKLGWTVASAHRIAPFDHADVEARLSTSEFRWFELKSQLTKRYSEITQADYIRDETDFLARLSAEDSAYAAHIGGQFAAWLQQPVHLSYFRGWTRLEDLFLADMAGLRTRGKRLSLGVTNRAGLNRYVDAKYLLQVTQDGARVCELRELAPVKFIRAGGKLHWQLRDNSKGRGLWILDPATGKPWFSYNLYRPSRPFGRHKLHAHALAGVPWTDA